MKQPAILPTWAPRVKPHLIRRLYESDAQGIYDEELIDRVGWDLYARCESFILANEASRGRVRCPVCGNLVLHSLSAKTTLHCAACGWDCPWHDYSNTIRNQQLSGGPEVQELFQRFVDAFPKAKEPPEKMLLIDGLIHGFHHFLTSGRTRRPVGVNLIDGHLDFVIDFLDRLTYGPNSTPGLRQTVDEWRENIRGKRRKGKTKKPV